MRAGGVTALLSRDHVTCQVRTIHLAQGRHFSFFQGGQNFDRLPRWEGARYEKTKILCAKTQKITISQIQWGQTPPLPPPNVVPDLAAVIKRRRLIVIYPPSL